MSDPHHGDALSDAESEQDLARRMQERTHRPASIDMALNLERELENEHEHEHDHDHELGEHSEFRPSTSKEALHRSSIHSQDRDGTESRRVSLDPEVLQHIITNLRDELARAQQQRDELAETLANAPTREAELREALDLLTEKSASCESELEKLKKKNQEDEESIQMLRTKLEESRRALMRLQTENRENKRMSMSHMSVDTSRANALSFFGGGPTSSKRASFTLLTGSGIGATGPGAGNARMNYSHRRISSVSEPADALDFSSDLTAPPTASHTISWPQESEANVKKSRRSSAFFGGVPMSMGLGLSRSATPSPPQQQLHLGSETSSNADTSAHEMEALKKERDAARAELAEAQEAREASEQCVAALRAFISAQAANGNGTNGILKLPPLPTEKNVDESAAAETATNKKTRPSAGSGWSFGKLFRTESGAGTDSTAGSPPPANERRSSNGAVDISTPTKASGTSPSQSASPSTATPGGAFSRTFGGLFSARTSSITSIGSVTSSNANNPATNTGKKLPARPPTAHGQQEPTLNGLGSDDEDGDSYPGASTSVNNSLGSRSSVTGPPEPLSPRASTDRESRGEIWVRNASSSLDADSGDRDTDRISLSSTRALAPKDDGDKFGDEAANVSVQVESAA